MLHTLLVDVRRLYVLEGQPPSARGRNRGAVCDRKAHALFPSLLVHAAGSGDVPASDVLVERSRPTEHRDDSGSTR